MNATETWGIEVFTADLEQMRDMGRYVCQLLTEDGCDPQTIVIEPVEDMSMCPRRFCPDGMRYRLLGHGEKAGA